MRKSLIVLGLFIPSFFYGKCLSDFLEFHAGFGASLTASGLPSQVSHQVAYYEDYVEKTKNEKGLPLGGALFGGLGYSLPKGNSIGFEYGVGYNMDMGIADMVIGHTVPQYVIDGIKSSDASSLLVNMALAMAEKVYPGLLARNNEVKGSFIDEKFLIYYKVSPNFKGVPMSFQLGTGLRMIHALDYYAVQSKNPADYIKADGNSLDDPFSWNIVSVWVARPIRIPFPLVTTDGKVFMHKNQPLMDFSFRWNVSMFYIDMDYSTEFRYIHNVKISAGILFDTSNWKFFEAKA